jgi:hypothetical protein
MNSIEGIIRGILGYLDHIESTTSTAEAVDQPVTTEFYYRKVAELLPDESKLVLYHYPPIVRITKYARGYAIAGSGMRVPALILYSDKEEIHLPVLPVDVPTALNLVFNPRIDRMVEKAFPDKMLRRDIAVTLTLARTVPDEKLEVFSGQSHTVQNPIRMLHVIYNGEHIKAVRFERKMIVRENGDSGYIDAVFIELRAKSGAGVLTAVLEDRSAVDPIWNITPGTADIIIDMLSNAQQVRSEITMALTEAEKAIKRAMVATLALRMIGSKRI